MRRTISLLSVLILLAGTAAAAVAPLPVGIAPETLPGGILHDRVASLAGIERFDGSADAPSATPAVWRQLVHELRRAAVDAPDWPATRRPAAAKLADRAHVPVRILHSDYGRLDPSGAVLSE